MNQRDLEARRASLVADLTTLKAEAGALGLWRTLHALDQATNTAGWELADLKTGRQHDTEAAKEES